jgi:hypothetical protein
MRLSRIAFPCLALFGAAASLPAQTRRVLSRDNPEAQLMGYYAAVMQFTPVGLPNRDGRLEIGGAATFIPPVSLEDRLAGFGGTKTENTNLCPVFPRLTVAKGFGRFSVEAGYTPPLRVCGAKANIVAFALARRLTLGATWDGYARVSALSGSVQLSAACSEDAVATPTDETCYGGTPSNDRVAPVSAAIEFAAAYQGWRARRLEPYLSVGVRYERINFDVNYTRTLAQGGVVTLPALDDHNRLRTTLSRIQLSAGMAWDMTRLIRLGGEIYYAPGALMTLRGRLAAAL